MMGLGPRIRGCINGKFMFLGRYLLSNREKDEMARWDNADIKLLGRCYGPKGAREWEEMLSVRNTTNHK